MKRLVLLTKIVSKKIFNKNRIDKFLAQCFKKYSRNHFKKCIIKKYVTVNDKIITSPDFKIKKGDIIHVKYYYKVVNYFTPEKIFLNIIYEDKYCLVINKPHSLVVHPGHGNYSGTLLNGLIYYYKDILNIPRAGIIHRLDKDTTGLIIIAKTISMYFLLKKMMKLRKIHREYKALVFGKIKNEGLINAPIGRNKFKRTCMAVTLDGKESLTYYTVKKKYKFFTLLKLKLLTGRTHQIRVHMLHIKHPILGDQKYKCNLNFFKGFNNSILFNKVKNFHRQVLHAYKIKFIHPFKNKIIKLKIKFPQDIKKLLSILKKYK
ncbi:MAG: RluA family pseudouridine synthase [Buchnera aphidicola (Periphyllus lyropictus)]|uniref:RluA family pseudouridine synthase n=1 Tax=Buchnera aphidicola TaxID=9 RepID=UPI001EB91DE8|nr:RluA family pseudouridine synthase [Buchnera aphidicola]NIH16555.1 RluA family pseudouridine synthase [Buchnera aphidicola (Periphyllus lyropictus)]USS94448.1 RluA family pseudouridine synthase [Buchnera aphidicola (Periphyllus lyropictus)]